MLSKLHDLMKSSPHCCSYLFQGLIEAGLFLGGDEHV